MIINTLAAIRALSDQDLLTRLETLAAKERAVSAEVVAHLAVLDARPALHASRGYGSLFAYCMEALRLSEDATYARIEVARASRRFPEILDLLAAGALTLSSARVLARHLTPENCATVLDRAKGKSRREVEVLVAELAPRPDVPTSLRKLPCPPAAAAVTARSFPRLDAPSPVSLVPPAARPVVQATAPARYRLQFTIGAETHERLLRLQTLLRREIPSGDPAAIFDRALSLLLEKVESQKLGVTTRPRSAIRPGTGRPLSSQQPSRYLPRAVRREVWRRDGARCAFVSHAGQRCSERTFLEFHHVRPYARQGPATVANISLRCRLHNQHEAEMMFGPHNGAARHEPGQPGSAAVPELPGPT